jgi:predicted TIM-barrel fold metal-dependent hydrolase
MFHTDMSAMATKPMTPRNQLPPGAWDCHAHVFGPFARYPLLPGSAYPPPLAPADSYIAMLDKVGFANGVVVQPAAYGFDNTALLAALSAYPDRLRGVAVVDPSISEDDLIQLRAGNVRGVCVTESVGGRPLMGSQLLQLDHLETVAPKLAASGLHLQIWADAAEIAATAPRLLSAGVPIVLDHMAQLDVASGVKGQAFLAVLDLARSGQVWIKVQGLRVSKGAPAMADVRPFFETLIETAPDQLIWGSDWPFIALGHNLPDPAELVDILGDWAGSALPAILVDNPDRLYG